VRVGGALDVGRLLLVVVGFTAGVGAGGGHDRLIPHQHAGGPPPAPRPRPGHDHHDHDDREARRGYAVVGALSLHRIPEGLAIGAGFAMGGPSNLGLLLAIARRHPERVRGIVMAAPLRQGASRRCAACWSSRSPASPFPAATLVGLWTAEGHHAHLPFILALAAHP